MGVATTSSRLPLALEENLIYSGLAVAYRRRHHAGHERRAQHADGVSRPPPRQTSGFLQAPGEAGNSWSQHPSERIVAYGFKTAHRQKLAMKERMSAGNTPGRSGRASEMPPRRPYKPCHALSAGFVARSALRSGFWRTAAARSAQTP